jgi:hypothetical protein
LDTGPLALIVAEAKMTPMNGAPVPLPRRRGADPRIVRALLAERREQRRARPPGRAWINGREVGGTDPRYAHLSQSYD